MNDYVTYSMGICSTYIAARLAETCKNPVCVWSDTGGEDGDTYRFGLEVAERFDLEIIEASSGIKLFDWFERNKMIPARQIPACSIELKILPSQRFFQNSEPGRVAYGYDIDEEDRAERTLDRWKFPHLTPWFPLVEWGVSKADCFGYFLEKNIQPPRMYKHFKHANCLPCKNFRVNDWLALAHFYPEVFARSVEFENRTGLRFMQDGPLLRDMDIKRQSKRRGHKGYYEPAFSFDSGCDACSRD